MHVIAVGAIYVDTILSVPHYPGEDEKLRAQTLTRRRGGNNGNTLEVLQQLTGFNTDQDPSGIRLHLMSVLPARDSEAVRFVRDSLKNVALDPCCIYRQDTREAPSSIVIKSRLSGSRTIVSYNALSPMTASDFAEKADILARLEGAKGGWYHFEGREPHVVLACIQYLRTSPDHQGFKISVEVEKPSREGLTEMAAEADMVFYSRTWAEASGFKSAAECLEGQVDATRPDSLLCCTWGSAGASVVQKVAGAATASVSVPAWHPENGEGVVIDTIGAGDTFISGMLYALSCHHDDWTLKRKLHYANEIAGRKVLQEGFGDLGAAMLSRAHAEE